MQIGDLLNRDETIYRAFKGILFSSQPNPILFIDGCGCSVLAKMNREDDLVFSALINKVGQCRAIYKINVGLSIDLGVFPIQQGKVDHAILLDEHFIGSVEKSQLKLPLNKAEYLACNCELAIQYD